ncbi:MAG TPA: glycosyltransferase family 39 protein [Pyrinomonadaceae bacterium]|nr:glycosyltransferase family 39 protein [Pyrinomonadaceae bacterium]
MDESLKQDEIGTVARLPGAPFAYALAYVRRAALAHKAELAALCLLFLMAANLFTVIRRKTITNDETVLIPAAYYHLVTDDFQLVHEHPPLCKLLAGVPLLFVQPNEARPEVIAKATNSSERDWAYQQSFWNDNLGLFHRISFWARIPAILLTLALGWLVFQFARELFGARAALLALSLFVLEPTLLAHGRVVQTDVPAAFGYLLVFYTLYHYVQRRTLRRALLVGAAAGLSLLAKFSMLIVAPVLLAVFLTFFLRAPRDGESRTAFLAHASLAVLASLLVINAVYFFHSRPLTTDDVRWVWASFPEHPRLVWASVSWLRHLMPTDFILGIYWQLWHSKEGHSASLLGMYSAHGWWYYFPVAFALKTTLPFLLLSVSSLVWSCYRLLARRERLFLVLLVPIALYTAFVMMSTINIGVRYFLPAVPFLCILAGALLDRLLKLARARTLALGCALLLISWVAVEAVRAYPHHMSYMNQLASPRPHWYYLSDSNVEWGDDVGELTEYLRARGETRVTAALLGGYATVGYNGVAYLDALALPDPTRVETRYVAIGASFLNGSTVPGRANLSEEQRVNFFDAYRRLTPEAVFGGSIYLFRMND